MGGYSNSSPDFWDLAKIVNNLISYSFLPFLSSEDTTVVTFHSRLKSLPKLYLKIPPVTSDYIPPTHPRCDFILSVMEILNNDVFYVLSDLNPQRTYGADEVPIITLEYCASVLTPGIAELPLSSLPVTSISTFFWKFAHTYKKGKCFTPSNYSYIFAFLPF